MKLGLLLLFASLAFAQTFYPYPFEYGVKASETVLEHGILTWTFPDGTKEPIAWNVSEFGTKDGYIKTLKIESAYGYYTMSIEDRNWTYKQVWFPKANNQDDMKLAVSVEQTVNMNQANQVCKAESKGNYWQVRALYNNTYDWIIERSFALHNTLFNGAKWSWVSNETWKVVKVS